MKQFTFLLMSGLLLLFSAFVSCRGIGADLGGGFIRQARHVGGIERGNGVNLPTLPGIGAISIGGGGGGGGGSGGDHTRKGSGGGGGGAGGSVDVHGPLIVEEVNIIENDKSGPPRHGHGGFNHQI